ncbi:MAG: OmpA family protein [Saprospiraceae bacterium]|nr:OmpA family protein [Saprospiraceae bacterium]
MERTYGWWIWVIGCGVVIGLLWMRIGSCRDSELADRANQAMWGYTAPIDSAAYKIEEARKRAAAIYDSAAMAFRDGWTALGNPINVRIDTVNRSIPAKGIEVVMLEWIAKAIKTQTGDAWFTMDRVLFNSGTAEINAVSEEQLDNLALILRTHPRFMVEIASHDLSSQDPEANRKLSQLRSEAILQALLGRGVDINRLTIANLVSELPGAQDPKMEGQAPIHQNQLHLLWK